jgi:hypothetical protein
MAAKLRTAFSTFRAAFPNWHKEAREFVTDGHTVVARMHCTGTHQGEWQGLPPTGRRMKVDEVYFFRISDDRITGLLASKIPGPGCVNSPATTPVSANSVPWASRRITHHQRDLRHASGTASGEDQRAHVATPTGDAPNARVGR